HLLIVSPYRAQIRSAHVKTIAFRQHIGNFDELLSGAAHSWSQEEVMEIKNASVLITGASRGLGRALAVSLARQGEKVVLVARHADDLEAADQQIRTDGHEAHAIVADVGDKSAIYSIAGETAALTGPVDILILNASTLGAVPLRLLLDTECEDLE